MTDGGHADADQVVDCQLRQHLGIDIIVAKSGLVLPQTQAAQPGADIQRFPRFHQTGFQCDNTDSEEWRANEWAR
jgi:hypothetical protein